MDSPEYRHLLAKARAAKEGGHDAWRVQSTGEKLAVALVLDRADWLREMGYGLAEAIDRVGAEWISLINPVARALDGEGHSPRMFVCQRCGKAASVLYGSAIICACDATSSAEAV